MRHRTCLITGASSGIGKKLALDLVAKDNQVIGLSRSADPLLLSSKNFTHFPLDLSDLKQVTKALLQLKKFPLDTLIFNAGKGHFGHLEQLSYEQIQSLIDLNFTSTALITKALLPLLKTNERSDILFIGSEAALAGKKKGSIYCASKFALRGFSQALRAECASSPVRVCSIQPGVVRTPFYDDLSFGPHEDPHSALEAEDVVATALLCLSLPARAVCEEIVLSPMKKSFSFSKDS